REPATAKTRVYRGYDASMALECTALLKRLGHRTGISRPELHLEPAARRWRNRPGVLAIREMAVLRARSRDLSRFSVFHRRMSRGEISIGTVRPGSISLSIASKAAWTLRRKASWAGARTFHCSADIVLGAPVRRTSVGFVLISQACGTPSFTP